MFIKKEYRVIGKTPEGTPLTVLGAAARAFADSRCISMLVITVPSGAEDGEAAARDAMKGALSGNSPSVIYIPGGESRRVSVFHALCALKSYEPSHVLIHDGARPWVDAALIRRAADAALEYGAAVPALNAVETPKEADEDGFVLRHLRRASIFMAQTPQAFAFEGILRAHEAAAAEQLSLPLELQYEYTDDAEIWAKFIGRVKIIEGSKSNIKITFPSDLGMR
ncbi:MAG: 2-C-methyl-D-erythritol 4-phosphate cytidylyltransferase [Spirochaetaceae bacterium]|nr:2-C-methyl-D-erythritol 4-phosphate cytidylyltransferase [Spirochaetaceae bacterium]